MIRSAGWSLRPGAADVAALQELAGLELLAVSAYSAVLGLAAVRGGDPALLRLLASTRGQHADHAETVNAAVVAAGGTPRTDPDPALLAQVRAREPAPRTAGGVLALAEFLEDTATRTYTRTAGTAGTPALRMLLLSVAGVEAQHLAALRTVGALLAAGAAPGAGLDALPAAAGSVGCPVAFVSADAATQ